MGAGVKFSQLMISSMCALGALLHSASLHAQNAAPEPKVQSLNVPPPLRPAACTVRVQGLTIHAETCDRDTDADTLELEGNVQIVFGDKHLQCDHTRVNFRAGTLDAQGNVLLTSPQAIVGGERILLEYGSTTGMIFNGFVDSGPVHFEGRMISKLGEEEYMVDSARFTACNNCPESWSFTGQQIRAELGAYAFIKNGWFRIGGFRILPLPYLVVPLKSDRQSGLLTPEMETSDSGGFTLAQSTFWAISRSQDATFTLKNYEKRGLKSQVNYRYMLSDTSYGELDFASIKDRVFGQEARLDAFRPGDEKGQALNRWFTRYEHYLELPEGFVQRAQINNASDLQYSKDFPLETKNNGDTAMENRMSLTKNSGLHHFSIDASYYVNMLQYDPIASNNDSVHRVPELRYSKVFSKIGDTDWLYSLDVDAVQFNRSEYGYDDLNAAYNPSGPNKRHATADGSGNCTSDSWYNDPSCHRSHDGAYDEGTDLIRTGHRMDLRGSVLRPFRFGNFFDMIPKVSYRETSYQFNVDKNPFNTRRFVRAEVATRALFSRIYGDDINGQDRYKHEIIPEVTFTTIPWLSHPAHAFFGSQQDVPFFSQETISDSDLNGPYGLQFDFNDRVVDRKLMTFGVTNKLVQKKWKDGVPSYRQILAWKLAQSYDFYQEESRAQIRQPLSDFVSDLRISLDQFEVYQRANYFPYQHVTNSSTRLRYNFLSGDFVQLAYVLNFRDITPGQDVDSKNRTEDYTLSVRKTLPLFDILGRVTYDMNPSNEDQRFKSYGYGAQIKLPGDCWYFNLIQYRTTGGENNFRGQIDFIWDGQKKNQLPELLLDTLGF